MKYLTLKEVVKRMEGTGVEEDVLKEMMLLHPEHFAENMRVDEVLSQASDLMNKRHLSRALMMAVDSRNEQSVMSVLYPQITLEEADPREGYWLGETLEERSAMRAHSRKEFDEVMAKSVGVSVRALNETAFFSWGGKADLGSLMAVLNIRRSNMAVGNMIYAIDNKISREKVPMMSSPFKKLSDQARICQHYERAEVDAKADPGELVSGYAPRVSSSIQQAVKELAYKLLNGSGIWESKEVENVEWFLITDPIRERYATVVQTPDDLPNLTVMSTLDIRMDGRAFLIPRITYKNGMTESFGWRLSDVSRLKFVEVPLPGYEIKHYDQLNVCVGIVGELIIKDLRTGEVK